MIAQALRPLADSDVGKGSPIGLLVVLLLIVAVYFLYRSMNRHLGKVPREFSPDQRPPADQPPAADQPPDQRPPADQPPGRPDGDGG